MSGRRQARALTWNDLHEGMVAEWQFTVRAADMEAFAALSGDFNPLHDDDAFARRKGFPGRVVYGALLTAQLSRLVGMELPGREGMLTGLTASFGNPVQIDDQVDFRAQLVHKSDAVRAVSLKYEMRCGKRLIAKGTVEAILRDAD